MDRVKDKVAVVTGGGMGIGRATSLLLAREGATVAVLDTADQEAQSTVEDIHRACGRAAFWHTNVANENEVRQNLAQINSQFGKIDILVNNAGVVGANKPTHELTEEEWDRHMAVNVKGVFFCTKHVIPYMKANRGGAIINISSIYGLVGPGKVQGRSVPEYHAAKAAVRLMAKADAMIYAADRIRVNSLHPGYIWTPMVEKAAEKYPGGAEAVRKLIAGATPLGGPGAPEDIAWGVLYLASDESAFVTGTELVIDGGYTAH